MMVFVERGFIRWFVVVSALIYRAITVEGDSLLLYRGYTMSAAAKRDFITFNPPSRKSQRCERGRELNYHTNYEWRSDNGRLITTNESFEWLKVFIYALGLR